MILTLKEDNKKIIFNDIIPKTDKQEEIEKLYRLYSAVNYEYGYLKHGSLSFYIEKPEEFEITSKSILFYSTYIWGNEGINGFYPVEHCTTTAQQTLNIIREILHKKNSNDIILNNFFNAERREVTSENKPLFDKFDINDQLEKLKFILSNKKLAIPLLKEAYLDFYLFIDLLDKIDIVPTEEVELNKIPNQYDNASSNTKILKIANSFSKLR